MCCHISKSRHKHYYHETQKLVWYLVSNEQPAVPFVLKSDWKRKLLVARRLIDRSNKGTIDAPWHPDCLFQFEKELCFKTLLDNLTCNLPLLIKTKTNRKTQKLLKTTQKTIDLFIISHLLKQDHSIPTDKQVQIQR